MLKQEAESAEKYKKTEGAYEECSSHYEKIVAQMKNSFVSEYDDTIKTIVDKIGDDVEKVDDKETLKNAVSEFTAFKDTLKDEFEKYNTVEQDSFDEYNSTIDEYVKKYNDRVTAIEKAEEEARKKAEEEAKKKLRKRRKRKQKRKQRRKRHRKKQREKRQKKLQQSRQARTQKVHIAVIQGQKKATIITITAAMIAVVAPDPAVILMEMTGVQECIIAGT